MQGAHARLEAGRVVVESPDDTELLDMPSGTVERIVCFGAAGISAGLRSWALATEVDLVFLSRRGSYLGHALAGAGQHRMARLRAQLAAADDSARAITFGRAVVDAKVRKQMILLRRLARRGNAETVTDAAGQMDQLLVMLPRLREPRRADGYRGRCGGAYFGALGRIMPEGMTFAGRSRQPPEDIINAALSYGVRDHPRRGRVRTLGCWPGPGHRHAARRAGSPPLPGAGPDGGVPAADRGPGAGLRRPAGRNCAPSMATARRHCTAWDLAACLGEQAVLGSAVKG